MPFIVNIEDFEDAGDGKGCLIDMPVMTEADSDLGVGDMVFAQTPANSSAPGVRFLGRITHVYAGRGECYYSVIFHLGEQNVERQMVLGRERLSLAMKGAGPHHG